MKKNELSEILGYQPSRGQRLEFLKKVQETGKSIQEVASEYQMPDLYIKDENGMIEVAGVKMTPSQYQEKHPFKKIVTIATKNNDE